MAHSHAISALVRKREEFAWLLSEAGKLQRQIAKKLSELDGTLAVLGYEHDPMRIRKRRKNAPRMFKRGQLRRIIFDILREGPCISTDAQFAAEIIKRLDWNAGDRQLAAMVALKVRDVRKAIGRELRRCDGLNRP